MRQRTNTVHTATGLVRNLRALHRADSLAAAGGAPNEQTLHTLPVPRRVRSVRQPASRQQPIWQRNPVTGPLIMITNGIVIIGLDDSPASRAAHRWAAAYAHATGKVLRAVHVLDWPIGLNLSSVKSGARLYLPRQDIAGP